MYLHVNVVLSAHVHPESPAAKPSSHSAATFWHPCPAPRAQSSSFHHAPTVFAAFDAVSPTMVAAAAERVVTAAAATAAPAFDAFAARMASRPPH